MNTEPNETETAAGQTSALTEMLCGDELKISCFEGIINSDYPENFIPACAELIVKTDYGSPDGDCTVISFHDPQTGIIHILDVTYNAKLTGREYDD